jgi:hypothetical protein
MLPSTARRASAELRLTHYRLVTSGYAYDADEDRVEGPRDVNDSVLIPCRKCGTLFDPRPGLSRLHPTDTCDDCTPDPFTAEQIEQIANVFVAARDRR